jgi:ATP/maltotriose-dependent transcriptional regulator MalT
MTGLKEQAAPAANRHIIERPRLTRLLNETSARVILLVAPAGYGKTVLARQWLSDKQAGWYTATGGTDIATLGLGLLEAADHVAEDIGHRFREWLLAQRKLDDVDQAAAFLAEDLTAFPSTTWLVVDDYHELSSEAEQLLDRLRRCWSSRLLVTTRRRPSWCKPRDLVYEEILEIDRPMLAMNRQEATRVLHHLGEDAAEVINVADGWPAVIGLASFARTSPRLGDAILPPELHAYVADELYSTLAPYVRSALASLSLFLSVSTDRASRLLGERSDAILAEGLRVGFLSHDGEEAHRFHPLLRRFLHRKLRDLPVEELEGVLRASVDVMLAEEDWENVFEVAGKFGAAKYLGPLIEASLHDLLAQGLVSTLSRFVSAARASGISSPVITLAEAEISFREGVHDRSRSLAESAGAELGAKPSLASRAFCRAGQSAYFSDDLPGAVRNFSEARKLAATTMEMRDAQWGLFLAAVEREDEATEALLRDFEMLCGSDPEDLLRAQNGRLHFGMRVGSVHSGLAGAEAAALAARSARDPVIRVSFWHVYAGALRVAAAYDEALLVSDTALSEADAFGLHFAQAHVQLTRSAIYLGLGRYSDGLNQLSEARSVARQTGDAYLRMSERALRCRAYLLQRDMAAAISVIDASFAQTTSSGQYSEFLSLRALLSGMTDSGAEADRLLMEAREVSGENEAVALNACVTALVDLEQGATNLGEFTAAFKTFSSKGVLDPFVFAFRLEPRLTQAVNRIPQLQPPLRQLLDRIEAPSKAGPSRRGHLLGSEALTPREREVFALLGQGKTNREIANALFLAEATVKVHVRHVLRKLGVRTRTEAAIHAVKKR